MSNQPNIRVLIVDDHAILRMGLALFLQSQDDFILLGEAANGQQAVELCDELQPDVVLMDIVMPVMDGLAATQIITRKHPEIAIVVLTSSFTESREQEALRAGAREYLWKNITSDKIAETIRAAVQKAS